MSIYNVSYMGALSARSSFAQLWLIGGVVGSASKFPHVFITLRKENPEMFNPLGLKQSELWVIKLIGWLSISVGAFWEKAKKL